MKTIFTSSDILLQIHRNHLTNPLGDTVEVRFMGFNNTQITTQATVQALTNCFILTVSDVPAIRTLGLNATLELVTDGEPIYSTPIQLQIPDEIITIPPQ